MKAVAWLAALTLVLPGCGHDAPMRKSVVYEVGGDVGFASYDNSHDHGIEYPPGVRRVELSGDDVPQPPKALYTWSRPAGPDGRSWCRITVDGKKVAEEQATGEANDASCLILTVA